MSTGDLPAPRRDLGGLRPYRSSATAGGRILLHANENPYPPPEAVMAEILEASARLELNRYPDPSAGGLVDELAAYAGVDPSWVWVGDGSNEVLLQACLTYGGAGRRALIFEPTYRMHYRQARAAGTLVDVVPRRADLAIDLDAALKAIELDRPEIVFICTPNNPTGTITPFEVIGRIAEASPGLVVVDEAYHEFCGETFVPELKRFRNVMVVRTLSKAFRLAGVRLGYAIAHPDLLGPLALVAMPYALSSFTQLAATIVVRRRREVLDRVAQLVSERERLRERLEAMPGFEPFPSGANFVLVRHERSAEVCAHLADRGIVVRDFTGLQGAENCFRVTAGTPQENDAFLEAVSAFV